MTKVLIVSRTKMRGGVCVGGFDVDAGENVRLLPLDGQHSHHASVPYRIGQVWEMDLRRPSDLRPPHVEDMLVRSARREGDQPTLAAWLGERVPTVEGDASKLFGGTLHVSGGGTAYVGHNAVPTSSVAFWRPSADLELAPGGRPHYRAPFNAHTVSVAYVGESEPDPIIAAGSLVRMSLARWFAPGGDAFEGCWLQVSGWYPESE